MRGQGAASGSGQSSSGAAQAALLRPPDDRPPRLAESGRGGPEAEGHTPTLVAGPRGRAIRVPEFAEAPVTAARPRRRLAAARRIEVKTATRGSPVIHVDIAPPFTHHCVTPRPLRVGKRSRCSVHPAATIIVREQCSAMNAARRWRDAARTVARTSDRQLASATPAASPSVSQPHPQPARRRLLRRPRFPLPSPAAATR